MAAGGFKEFVAGEVLDQDEINDFLMQGVLVFAGTAARGSAITSPVEGQFAFLKDSDALTFYDGSAWTELSTTPGAAVVSGTTGSPTVGTVSSGGTTYNVYSFTGSGSITFSEAGFIDYLIIGGGGGGGRAGGAGGGAGGYRNNMVGELTGGSAVAEPALYVIAGTATVTVGGGGAGAPGTGKGSDGTESYLTGVIAVGGGGGGSINGSVFGGRGGSGGGLSGIGVLRNGTNGDSTGTQGGGGGARSGGLPPGSDAVINGGLGLDSTITGSSVTRGGGGAGFNGLGGSGGGGNSTSVAAATNGTANTGGGGGAWTGIGSAGNGGSGIVIVRVAV